MLLLADTGQKHINKKNMPSKHSYEYNGYLFLNNLHLRN